MDWFFFLDASLVRARAGAYTCTSSGSYAPTLNDFIYVPVDCKHFFFATCDFAFFNDRAEHFQTCSFQFARKMSQMSLHFQLRWLTRRPVAKKSPVAVHASFFVGHL